MLVTLVKGFLGKYKPGQNFELPDKQARALVAAGILRTVDDALELSPRTGKPKRTYTRRDMQAES